MNDLTIVENGLIPIYGNEQQGQLVNARELHEFLEVGDKFAQWIERRIAKYEFEEGIDFFTISGKSSGGRPTLDYILIMDVAKEIAMVENNDRGREVRKYFIEVEKKAKQSNVVPLSKDKALVTVLRTTADLVEGHDKISKRVDELEQKLDEQITLKSGEQRKLQKEIAKRVYELATKTEIQQLGFTSNEQIKPDLSKVKKKLFSGLHRDIKDCFAVPSFKDVRRNDLDEVVSFVKSWRPKLVS